MDISKHTTHPANFVVYLVLGIFLCILSAVLLLGAIINVFLLPLSGFSFWAGLFLCRRYKRVKRTIAFLKQTPGATFAEVALTLRLKPAKLRKDIQWAIRYGVFHHVEFDTEKDVLVSTVPPPPREELATIPCPHCGAPVTISTKLGGQCEYCDSWLPGTE